MPGYNQYIGMRYVPLIDGAWNASTSYEPLVVVSYEGNSYISKTFVPAGTLPSNETYWMLSANYNAQVEQYRQEVRQYQADVSDLSDTVADHTLEISAAESDIDDLQAAVNELAIGQVVLTETAISATYSGTVAPSYSATVSGSANLSNNAAIRAYKQLNPDKPISASTMGGSTSWGILETLSASVTESGSIADNNYVCTVNATCRYRNMSNVDQSNPSASVRLIITAPY